MSHRETVTENLESHDRIVRLERSEVEKGNIRDLGF